MMISRSLSVFLANASLQKHGSCNNIILWRKSIANFNLCSKKSSSKCNERISQPMMIKYIEKYQPGTSQYLPKALLQICEKGSNTLHIIDPEAAKIFVSVIIDDLSKNTCHVAELNPGYGTLTRELLKAGVPFINLYEPQTYFQNELHKLMQEYPNQLRLIPYNIAKLHSFRYVDNMTNSTKVEEILHAIEPKKWEDDTCVQFIGAITNHLFMKQIVINIIFQNCYMARGRPVFYIAITPLQWKGIKSRQFKSAPKNILYELFCETQLLGVIGRNAYIPWQNSTQKKCRTTTNQKSDKSILYIVKIEPKRDIFTRYIDKTDLLYFWHFLRHNLISNTNRIIPQLEKVVPGCGVRLIQEDYSIFTQFSDLTAEEILRLFQKLRNWPEFENSSFIPSMDSVLDKLYESEIRHRLPALEVQSHT